MPQRPSKSARKREKFLVKAHELFEWHVDPKPVSEQFTRPNLKAFERALITRRLLDQQPFRGKESRLKFSNKAHYVHIFSQGSNLPWNNISEAQKKKLANTFIKYHLNLLGLCSPEGALEPCSKRARNVIALQLADEKNFTLGNIEDLEYELKKTRNEEARETIQRRLVRYRNLLTLLDGVIHGLRNGTYTW
ncbi:MAG: hypothetical protein HY393_03060 [Candidatus Diapherotrites archaeon]|nr:hypothetical protein [Candidatus Diapherotrites archaeon]